MQYLLHQKFPTDIANLITEYLPAHPMKKEVLKKIKELKFRKFKN
jgi:hypothetical protein